MKQAKEVAAELVDYYGRSSDHKARLATEQALVAYAREAFEEAAKACEERYKRSDADAALLWLDAAAEIHNRATELLGEEK